MQTCKSSLQCSCPASPGSSIVSSGLARRSWNWAWSENSGSPGRPPNTGRRPASQPCFQLSLYKIVSLPVCNAPAHIVERNRTEQMALADDYMLHPGCTVSSPVRRTCREPVLHLEALRDESREKKKINLSESCNTHCWHIYYDYLQVVLAFIMLSRTFLWKYLWNIKLFTIC